MPDLLTSAIIAAALTTAVGLATTALLLRRQPAPQAPLKLAPALALVAAGVLALLALLLRLQ